MKKLLVLIFGIMFSLSALAQTAQMQPPKKPQKVIIDMEVLEAVAQYLGSRPFNEVSKLLNAIQKSAKVYTEPKKEEPKKEEPKPAPAQVPQPPAQPTPQPGQ